MKTRISKSDFIFLPAGFGAYGVVYQSPVTGKWWSALVDDMTIIDATKNCDKPKVKDLNVLKALCKRG